MNLIELIIDEATEMFGVHALSLVSNPAIQSDFIALGDEKPILLAEVSPDKQILMGAVLIPDKPIFRQGSKGQEDYYVFFSEETVSKTAEMFFKRGNQSNATLEHKDVLDGMTVFESWIVEDPEMDKSKKFGLNVPKGTWMVSMKVDDKEIWDNYVKNDKVFGFSLEGRFADILVAENVEQNFSDQRIDNALENIKQLLINHFKE